MNDTHPQIEFKSKITMSEKISFFVSQSDLEAELYCCVFHHPLCSAIITPYSQPRDRLRIVSNKEIFKDETTFVDGTSGITVRLIEAEGNEEQVPMDKIICHHLPICDASESWDFIFSRRPIQPEQYLDEYECAYDGNYYKNL